MLGARLRQFRRRRRGERGAVAMEAALVLPVLMLLVFGMIEFGLLMRDYVSVTAATRNGARLASAEAGEGPCTVDVTDTTKCTTPSAIPQLAQDAADTMDRSLTGIPKTSINYLLVYEANKLGYPCLTANVSTCGTNTTVPTTFPTSCSGYGNCVMFSWNTTKGAFRYSSGAWDSSTIDACTGEQDTLGIYLNTSHKWVTGMFGTTMPLNDKAVMQFEPLTVDQCLPGKHS